MTTITIDRAKLYPCGRGNYRTAWKWTYTYTVDGGPVAQYGADLASLRGMLRRKFRGAVVTEAWKV